MNSTAETNTSRAADGARSRRPLREAEVWQSVGGAWRQLYGSFSELGASIEWHEFQVDSAFDWSRSFHRRSLELCLNLSGAAAVRTSSQGLDFEPATGGFYAAGDNALNARRNPGQPHRFITVEFSAAFLAKRLSTCDGALHPLVEDFIRNPRRADIGAAHRLTAEHERLAFQLLQPPVAMAARDLWYQSKLLELIASFFFERPEQTEMFCERQKRVARERVERVVALLRERLSEPPVLEEIGRAVGCSPFYLSRTFSQEMGMTIPQYLRKLRIERAADLLRSGKYNVTEAAFEVGYSSLSHFSQSFCQIMGCCPTFYPIRNSNAQRPISTETSDSEFRGK